MLTETKDCGALNIMIVEQLPSPMTYNSPQPQALLEEDRTVAIWKTGLKSGSVRIIDTEQVFERDTAHSVN